MPFIFPLPKSWSFYAYFSSLYYCQSKSWLDHLALDVIRHKIKQAEQYVSAPGDEECALTSEESGGTANAIRIWTKVDCNYMWFYSY